MKYVTDANAANRRILPFASALGANRRLPMPRAFVGWDSVVMRT